VGRSSHELTAAVLHLVKTYGASGEFNSYDVPPEHRSQMRGIRAKGYIKRVKLLKDNNQRRFKMCPSATLYIKLLGEYDSISG